jgi:hypothetical protein
MPLSLLEKFNSIYGRFRKDGIPSYLIFNEWEKCHNKTVHHRNETNLDQVYITTFDRALRDWWKIFGMYSKQSHKTEFLKRLQCMIKNFQPISLLVWKHCKQINSVVRSVGRDWEALLLLHDAYAELL